MESLTDGSDAFGRHGGISCGWNHCIRCDTRVFYGASRITSLTESFQHG